MKKAYVSLNQTECAILDAASRIFVERLHSGSFSKEEVKTAMDDSIEFAIEMAETIEKKVVSEGETGL